MMRIFSKTCNALFTCGLFAYYMLQETYPLLVLEALTYQVTLIKRSYKNNYYFPGNVGALTLHLEYSCGWVCSKNQRCDSLKTFVQLNNPFCRHHKLFTKSLLPLGYIHLKYILGTWNSCWSWWAVDFQEPFLSHI